VRRMSDLDDLACPRCGGLLRLIAMMEDSAAAGKIPAHLSLLHPRTLRCRPRRRPTYALLPPPASSPSHSRHWTLPLKTAA